MMKFVHLLFFFWCVNVLGQTDFETPVQNGKITYKFYNKIDVSGKCLQNLIYGFSGQGIYSDLSKRIAQEINEFDSKEYWTKGYPQILMPHFSQKSNTTNCSDTFQRGTFILPLPYKQSVFDYTILRKLDKTLYTKANHFQIKSEVDIVFISNSEYELWFKKFKLLVYTDYFNYIEYELSDYLKMLNEYDLKNNKLNMPFIELNRILDLVNKSVSQAFIYQIENQKY
jgi:hypothetical protein